MHMYVWSFVSVLLRFFSWYNSELVLGSSSGWCTHLVVYVIYVVSGLGMRINTDKRCTTHSRKCDMLWEGLGSLSNRLLWYSRASKSAILTVETFHFRNNVLQVQGYMYVNSFFSGSSGRVSGNSGHSGSSGSSGHENVVQKVLFMTAHIPIILYYNLNFLNSLNSLSVLNFRTVLHITCCILPLRYVFRTLTGRILEVSHTHLSVPLPRTHFR